MQNRKVLNYTLLRPLGKGGMAEVWFAENKIGNVAAVKILSEELAHNAQVVERFGNEARVTVRLKHPNIRQVYDYDEIDGRPCMVMEYLEGDDLAARMKRGEHFTDEQLKKWWNQLSSALNYTHQQGVVHRDIKPSNIFIDREDNVKLLDFGIAKVRDSITSTATGATMGTLMYMSPEQVRDSKHIDAKTDLYSLAVSFVHLLAGHAPYDRDTTDDFEIRLNIVQNPLDLSGLPADWQAFLRPYLAKKPEERPALVPFGAGQTGGSVPPVAPASEETVVGGVNAPVCDDATVAATPAAPSQSQPQPKSQPQSRKRKAWPWILAACAVVGIVAAIMLLPGGKKNDVKKGSAEKTATEVASFVNEDRTFTVGNASFVMKPVEGGTFQMGGTSEQGSDSWDNEKPVHDVTLGSYYMGETEVTQELWKAVMENNNPSYFKGDDLPVETVSWDDCQKFIKKLNELTGKKFRLPTEAEWEYAARGGNKSKGYKYSGSNTPGSVAWYGDNSGSKTHPVKTKAANELGLYDMSGNVWEWCSDWYGDYSSDAQTNPKGASSGSYRVLRGGGWFSIAGYCRVSSRNRYDPSSRYNGLGLRLVLVP